MTYLTNGLANSHLFQQRPYTVSQSKRVLLAYERAKAISVIYGLTAEDVLTTSVKFWEMHTDPIMCMDSAAAILLTIQYNLCAGTLSMFSAGRPDISRVLQDVLSFTVSGQFCLTEVGHGLDAVHIETTAISLPSGGYELHTPNAGAAKHMPPTVPAGLPCVAVVFAQTIINGESRGVKPFLVPINDGYNMMPGISCKTLPCRNGNRPINHALTYFNRVHLPQSALLGSEAKPANFREAFFHGISRVASGTLAMSAFAIPVIQISSSIAARYSLRRTVFDAVSGKVKPVIAFRTQQVPILTALAQSFVLKALLSVVVPNFVNDELDFRSRHALATISKVVSIQHIQSAQLTLADRCGAQGLFDHNQIIELHTAMRGAAIAEGDILGISIRLASELLLGRYDIPESSQPDSLLARHEAGLFEEIRGLLIGMTHHRAEQFNNLILPQCVPLVEAIGHRMAFDAAVERGVPSYITDLYAASVVKMDPSWYVEHAELSRQEQRAMEDSAVQAAYPHLQEMVDQIGVDTFITAPIVSDQRWNEFVDSLDTIGDAQFDKPAFSHDSPSLADGRRPAARL
ncbi:hypothetical protein SERLA73DRAFT_111417 [Serpula lacrymans var. lacrymans S7.3]|uniref:Acyl-CoA oxidase C-alpha1 domain-containing protein n=2 Tax=Serpula lacrymans var. lacrymans TaxID=341189 RepID=F8Q5B3_SERL3|nr:uncharacterized protein SERLADRAFT_416849 [Serpula lacrymans var. lacrymans S7.9]EGN96740.1 hypothetical protein SERLA73DRAFT_111417 [Serpula lacrymans var. lacrymans S7.3]EGO22348.1 hypothetical protein SERLADRAFT_416849 [Serpula lacrymans var. lacrymans S7.9]